MDNSASSSNAAAEAALDAPALLARLRRDYAEAKALNSRDAWSRCYSAYQASSRLSSEQRRTPAYALLQCDVARIMMHLGSQDSRAFLKATRAMPHGRTSWPLWMASIIHEAVEGDAGAIKALMAESRARFANLAQFQLIDRMLKDGGLATIARMGYDDDVEAAAGGAAAAGGDSSLAFAGGPARATPAAVSLSRLGARPQRVPKPPAEPAAKPPAEPAAVVVPVYTSATTDAPAPAVEAAGVEAGPTAAASMSPPPASSPAAPLEKIAGGGGAAAATPAQPSLPPPSTLVPPTRVSLASATVAAAAAPPPFPLSGLGMMSSSGAMLLRRNRMSTMSRMSAVYVSSLSPVAEGRASSSGRPVRGSSIAPEARGDGRARGEEEEDASRTSSSRSSEGTSASSRTSTSSASALSSSSLSGGASAASEGKAAASGAAFKLDNNNTQGVLLLAPDRGAAASHRTSSASSYSLVLGSLDATGLLPGIGEADAHGSAGDTDVNAPAAAALLLHQMPPEAPLTKVAAAAGTDRRFAIPDYIRAFDPLAKKRLQQPLPAASTETTTSAGAGLAADEANPTLEQQQHLEEQPQAPALDDMDVGEAEDSADDGVSISPVAAARHFDTADPLGAAADRMALPTAMAELSAVSDVVVLQRRKRPGDRPPPLPNNPIHNRGEHLLSAAEQGPGPEPQKRRRFSVRFDAGSAGVAARVQPSAAPVDPAASAAAASSTESVLNDTEESESSAGELGGDDVFVRARSAPPAPAAQSAAPSPLPFADLTQRFEVVKVAAHSYLKLDCIGKGGSSRVYRVLAEDMKVYALKRVRLARMDAVSVASYSNEIALLRRLHSAHPSSSSSAATAPSSRHIIRLVDAEVSYQTHCIHMVMEYGQCDLSKMLEQERAEKAAVTSFPCIDENMLRLVWQHMLLAVQTIHEARIVHGDLKPANFVFVEGVLKLIDFGIAKAMSNDTTNIVRDTQVGTINYMSPEAVLDVSGAPTAGTAVMKVGRPSDIWSLGIILYQMVYGKTPYSELNLWQKLHAIGSPTHSIPFPTVVNQPDLSDVLRLCLQRDSSKRPSIAAMLDHPFLCSAARRLDGAIRNSAALSTLTSEEPLPLVHGSVATSAAGPGRASDKENGIPAPRKAGTVGSSELSSRRVLHPTR